jgi:hypothetical protein
MGNKLIMEVLIILSLYFVPYLILFILDKLGGKSGIGGYVSKSDYDRMKDSGI